MSLFLSLDAIGQTQDPSPERCFEAYHVCGAFLDGFQAVLPDSNVLDTIWGNWKEIGKPTSGVCGKGGNFDNTMWLSFVACASKVHLKIHFKDCRDAEPPGMGMQAGLYTKCRYDRSVVCDNLENDNSGTLNLEYDDFEPGELIFLVLDGFAKSVCDFEIEVVEGVDKTIPTKPDATILNDGEIIGQNQLNCNQKGIAQRYTLNKPECKINYPPSCSATSPTSPNGIDSIKYVWEVSPLTGRYFVNNDSIGIDNDIVFTENGSYTISAKPIFHPAYGGVCENGACGDIISWTVNVRQADTIYNPPFEVCPGEIIDFCGQIITKDTVVFCAGTDCNVSAQSYVFKSARVSNLGKQYICRGSQFNFQGDVYTTDGNYSVKDVNDCTNTYTFEIVNVNVDVQVNASVAQINCTNTSSQLQSTLLTNWGGSIALQWTDITNNIISSNPTHQVNQSGTYSCLASVTLTNGEVCKDVGTVTVTKDVVFPSLSFVVPTYKCRDQNEALPSITINPSRSLNSAIWRRPNGTVLNALTITLDSALVASGIAYTFTGIADNGCEVDTIIKIPYDFSKADLSVSGDILTCLSPKTRLTLTTNLGLDSIKWQFSNGTGTYFICCDDQLVTSEQDQTGTYQASARTSSSRCFSTGSKFIAEDKIKPRNDLGDALKWHCNTKQLDIIPVNVESGSNIAYAWSTSSNTNILSPANTKDVLVGSTGSYVLNITNIQNGCSKADTIKVVNETNVPRNIVVETKDISCFGKKDGQIDIKLSEGGYAPYRYYVDNTLVDLTNSVNSLKAGNYQIMVKDNYDCEHIQSVTIQEPIELTVEAPSQFDVFYEESVLLDFISSYNINDLALIEWINDENVVLGTDETLEFNATSDQEITLVIRNENGCEAKARIKIIVNSDLELYLPNAFSPNGDGNNDRFIPFKNKIPVTSSSMKVYDRYGNMVFEGDIEFNNPDTGWDGSYNGKKVENGVYIYKVDIIDIKGNKINSTGSILVAR